MNYGQVGSGSVVEEETLDPHAKFTSRMLTFSKRLDDMMADTARFDSSKDVNGQPVSKTQMAMNEANKAGRIEAFNLVKNVILASNRY